MFWLREREINPVFSQVDFKIKDFFIDQNLKFASDVFKLNKLLDFWNLLLQFFGGLLLNFVFLIIFNKAYCPQNPAKLAVLTLLSARSAF